jgi:hypothetical protein
MRWEMIAAGVFLLVLWFACWATTVLPGTSAVTMQWVAGNTLAFLAGSAFGAALWMRRGA